MSDDSSESNGKDVSNFEVEEEDNFVWQDYLEMTNSEEVQHILFSHVEQSLQSSLQPGMLLEIPDKKDESKYWPAIIKMSCGPLLSLSFVALEKSPEFWCDIGKVDVHPLGWCEQQKQNDPMCKISLEPPESYKKFKKNVQDWHQLASDAVKDKQSVPVELLSGEGFTAIERIKQGMRIEVEDDKNPLYHWVATIIENVGGRLLLRYDTPDSNCQDFWLFYTSSRLFRLGWADEKGSPWQYRPPSSTKLTCTEDEWASILETARLEAELLPPPPDLFQEDIIIEDHQFEVGMKVEAVHPVNHAEICPATVIQVFETGHFLVKIDVTVEGEQELSWLCKANEPFIFPPGWCKKRNLQLTHPLGWISKQEDFEWADYLENCENVISTPENCFTKLEPAQDLGFEIGLKLEAVNPENPHQICVASINKTLEHLVWVHLESNDSFNPSHIVSTNSEEIFPVGWCGSNSYPLRPPLNYEAVCETNQRDDEKSPAQQEVSQKSSWCPKIYFNHKCFTGPFLSKGKLAQLPKTVGPGPVTLVLREVLSMLISVAYKSRQVLKELQCEGSLPPGRHLEVLKAKLKSAVYRANVAIVTSADQVPDFCQEVCSKLQSCPNLFGPELFGDSCPVGCSALSKSRFTNYWSKHKRHQTAPVDPLRTKKRGRKKLLTKCKGGNNASQQEGDKGDNNKQDEDELESDECESRPESEACKRKYKKKKFPQLEMRTRGAKLPNFALQLANWSWGKEGYMPAKKKRRLSSDTTNVSASSLKKSQKIVRKRGRPPLNKNVVSHVSKTNKLKPLKPCRLNGNPMQWSVSDVSKYLQGTSDCACMAQRLAEEDIDGHAFMLLNLPTIQENLQIQLGSAIKLCQHIERVKFAYFSEFF